MDDGNPYPTLLVLDWAINMEGIINWKCRIMIFENYSSRVILPLDLAEGERYTESVHEGDDVNHIYNLTMRDENWINPMADGMLNWEKYSTCFSNSDGEMKN